MVQKVISTQGKCGTGVANCHIAQSDEFKLTIDRVPINVHPNSLMVDKLQEVLNIVDERYTKDLSVDIKTSLVRGGGRVNAIYAARQAMCKAIIALYAGIDEVVRQEITKVILGFDRTCLIADSRRKEPKKYGGPGARARYQKSYR